MTAVEATVHQLKVTLQGINPPIWRRIHLYSRTPLSGLHAVIQVAMGWDDSQLCRLTHPSLSAMSHDIHAFGAEVARAMYDLLGGERIAGRQVPTPSLTPRGSTGPPPPP